MKGRCVSEGDGMPLLSRGQSLLGHFERPGQSALGRLLFRNVKTIGSWHGQAHVVVTREEI
jgi:hypothetical protein